MVCSLCVKLASKKKTKADVLKLCAAPQYNPKNAREKHSGQNLGRELPYFKVTQTRACYRILKRHNPQSAACKVNSNIDG